VPTTPKTSTQAPDSRIRPWLVMVYMAGDNSLTEEMVLALQDLMLEGAPDDDIIVAQFDPGGTGLATQRYIFSKRRGSHLEDFRDPEFDGLEVDTGDPEALKEFIAWAVDDVAPKLRGAPEPMRTMLILSGHGSGTTEDFFMKDDTATDSLTFDELAGVLEWYHDKYESKIDILGLDACYMCSGELAYEISDHVGVLIGAEGWRPPSAGRTGASWPK